MKFTWDTDKIVSLSAMAVGVGSLMIILYQTKLMRDSQHLSVLPYLAIAIQSNDETTNLTVRNSGIGPALLEDVRVRYKGRDFAMDPHDFLLAQRPGLVGTIPLGVDKLIPGRLVPAGEWIQHVGSQGEGRVTLLKDIAQLFALAEIPKLWLQELQADGPAADKAVIFITYTSVYGDRWHLRSDQFVPIAGPVPGVAR